MLIMLYIIILLVIILIAVSFYLVLLHRSDIKDQDKDFVPDAVEDKISVFKVYIEKVLLAFKSLYNVLTNKNVK